MGAANFMVSVRQNDQLYPTVHFFSDHDLAKRFYESMKELHDNAGSYTACVQFWTLDWDHCRWVLTAFN